MPPDPKALSLPRDPSICNTTISSTTFLLLETRCPLAEAADAFFQDRGPVRVYEPHRKITSKGGVSGDGAGDTDCSNMAVTAIVSQVTQNASLQHTEDKSSTNGNNGRSSGSESIPRCAAYLRKHYKDQKLHHSDLLLSP
uniref:Uncharacterized protein n=1 Tax=Amphimedon queenslandica TaxID=400682 RepID=A0A1X7V635_AMPQE